MLEKILKLYVMAMAGDVRSPTPHLFGPPGCGKSTVVEQAAEILGVNLHVINVSRISPLELEGVQMPTTGDDKKQFLELLLATTWSKLKAGDIVLWDEFLRGFPEVYNGLLDIMTSRMVAGHTLPPVFMIAASNSTVPYDKALEDRLIHIPVPDIRKGKARKRAVGQMIVDAVGLLPAMVDSQEMQSLIDTEIVPMYEILDQMGKGSTASISIKGTSVRNLIGQAKLKEIVSPELKELLVINNQRAIQDGKHQFVVLIDGKAPDKYAAAAPGLVGNEKLTPVQALNLDLNLQLIEMENTRREKGTEEDDEDIFNVDDVD